MICPQCGWTGDVGSEAHRTFIHAAAPAPDAGLRAALDRVIAEAENDRSTRQLSTVSDVTIEWLHRMRRAALSRQAEKETA